MKFLIGVAAIITLMMNCNKSSSHGQVLIEMSQWGGMETPNQAKTSVLYVNGTLVTPDRTSKLSSKALETIRQIAVSLTSSNLDFSQVGELSNKVPVVEGGTGNYKLMVHQDGKHVTFVISYPELFLDDKRPELKAAARAVLKIREAFASAN